MLNYKITGNSPKQIIFIHGNSSSLEVWNDVVSNPLFADYKLITIDLPGHGQSFRSLEPEKDYTLMGMANHLKAFIEDLNLNEYIIIGHSLGSNIVGEATDAFDGCKGFLLMGASIIGNGLSVGDIFKPNPNVGAYFMSEPNNEQLDVLVEDVAYNITPSQREFIKADFKNTDPQVRVQMAAAVAKNEYTDEIKNIEQTQRPVAVVFGAEDKLCNIAYLDKVPLDKWENKTFLIPKSGHFSQLDQPKVLAQIISEFAKNCF
jgi:pimeloyl-ACP methyl ester carboxylesterase